MSAKRKPVNVILGRFQPLSIGHFQMGKDLVAANGEPVIYVYIRSKSGKNSHLSDSLTERYMSDLVKKHSHVVDTFAMPNAYIPDTIAELQRRGYEPLLLGAGPDRFKDYERMVKGMKGVEVTDGFSVYELPTRITSATEVRNAIKEDDTKKFSKLTPRLLHKYYKEIQEELLNKEVVMENNTEDMNEARLAKLKFKKEYPEYNATYGGTLDAITNYVEDNGYFVNDEDFFTAFGDAFFKPKKGATQSKSLIIYKDKATQEPVGNLHVTIYNRGIDGNTFELTMYHDQIGVLKEGITIQRKIVRKALESLFSIVGKNNVDAKNELYELVKKFFGENGIEVFEAMTEANNDAIKKSHERLIEIAWSLRNREISEQELDAKDKDAIIKLSKMPNEFFSKIKESLESTSIYSINEMSDGNMDYLQKINMASMMLIKTNKPFSFEDYCTCMKRSHYIKKEFIPFLIMQGLSDYQIQRFVDNLLQVSYFHYTNYFLGHPARQYVRSIAAVQESEEVNNKTTLLEDMKRLNEFKSELNEATDSVIANVVTIIEDAIKQGKALMDMRTPLETIFKKRDIDFSFSSQAHFMIKVKGKKLVIINKSYVDDADAIVGDYAIGYL